MSELRNPGPLRINKMWAQICLALGAVGLAALFALVSKDAKQGWSVFLINHFYFLSLAVGGIFFLATQSITGAMWGAPVRRIAESFSAYLPFAFVTSAVVVFMAHGIYEWMDRAHVVSDPLLKGKAGYLSLTGFAIRTGVALVVLLFLTKKMVGNSLAQDVTASHEPSARNRVLSPVFLIVFALGITVLAFDHLMSLDPHWFSTMFGVYAFAGLAYSTHALLGIVTALLHRQGSLKDFVNANHFHDLGKWMFAFTVFWAYIAFSQFMLIWYANLPEETGYFLRRMDTGWLSLSVFLLVGKFFLPFFALLPRGAKRNPKILIGVGLYMMVAHWLDLLWVVQPEFFKDGPQVGPLGVLVSLGFAGVFGFFVLRFLARHNVVAIGDPRLHESVLHHHQ